MLAAELEVGIFFARAAAFYGCQLGLLFLGVNVRGLAFAERNGHIEQLLCLRY